MRFRIELEVSARDFGFIGDHTAPNNKTTEESMLFLCEIEAVFELRGRACVIVPGVPCELPPGAASIRPGTELLIVAPDGTELHTTLAALEMVGRGRPMNRVPFTLPGSVSKGQIAEGSKVYALTA